MERPPFKLAQQRDGRVDDQGKYMALLERCCTPGEESPSAGAPGRRRLTDLDAHIHCSIIGTCLSTTELRKLVPRFAPLDRDNATDVQIHHAAVELANAGGAAAKTLNKALDARYADTLKQFKSVADERTLRQMWRDALDSGAIPGAYWALMTHPLATIELRELAFGDVHMLSHLVGAANRADIRRLVALEKECAALQEQAERQQSRLNEIGAQRDAARRQLEEHAAEMALRDARQASAPDNGKLAAQVEALRHEAQEQTRKAALQIARREAAEQRALQQEAALDALRERNEQLQDAVDAAAAEINAMEDALARALEPDARQDALRALDGTHIVYVGGRPNSNAVLDRLVTSFGGRLTIHDGGIEDRIGMLSAVLPRAQLVVFPVDCVGHDAMNTLKRLCSRHGIRYFPVRTASIASFTELIARLAVEQSAQAAQAARPSGAVQSQLYLRHA